MMECTQQLDLECTQVERITPEQVGFLGILGNKYPVMRGPNKIGRDPQTCSIVLNLNSISRQHAVINVLKDRHMLMDLDSANKTRLNSRTLQAFIPERLSNGDTVQLGDVFGVYRLLQDESELPCTQALDVSCTQAGEVPDTPCHKPASRLRQAVVPESPDVSDKDDSFIVPSQPKPDNRFKSPSNKYIKASSKTIAIQPVGTNKIDNVFWKSSKKSNSFTLDDSSSSLNQSNQNDDIHEMETQPPDPMLNDSSDSIYTAETQLPPGYEPPNYNTDLNIPVPDLSKIKTSDEEADKENDNSIFNADTQLPTEKLIMKPKDEDMFNAATQLPNGLSSEINIHEQNTQMLFDSPIGTIDDNIFEAETQLPPTLNKSNIDFHEKESRAISGDSKDSIFTAETQLPKANVSDSVHSQETQLSKCSDETRCETFEESIVISKKDDDIFEAETQLTNSEPDCLNNDDQNIQNNSGKKDNESSSTIQNLSNKRVNVSKDLKNSSKDKSPNKLNKSDEVILFDEIETQNYLDDISSQPILANLNLKGENEEIPLSQSDTISDDDFEIKLTDNKNELAPEPIKRDISFKSDVTDCDDLDILPTQKIPGITNEDDTDCEDDTVGGKKDDKLVQLQREFEELPTQVIPPSEPAMNTNFEDIPNNNNINNKTTEPTGDKPCFEDMLRQAIPEDENIDFEDLPTQVIPEDVSSKPVVGSLQYSEEVVVSPFKIPSQTPVKAKRKDIAKTNVPSPLAQKYANADENDEKYYASTQEILEDLCTQKNDQETTTVNDKDKDDGDEMVPCTIEDFRVGERFPCLDGEIEITVNKPERKSSGSSDGEEKINKYVKSLSDKQISDVIGLDVTLPKRVPNDPSDVEVTPKKDRPLKFVETLLPDSQEIKTGMSIRSKTVTTESSSDSEQEKESQEQTPLVFRKKKRAKADVKQDLTSKFDVESLPTRIITRKRKPTAKVQESDAVARKHSRNILKPKFLDDAEQGEEVDADIITENICRLKTENEKKVSKGNSPKDASKEEGQAERLTKNSSAENSMTKSDPSLDHKDKPSNASKEAIVDLTSQQHKESTKSRSRNGKSKNSKETVSDKLKQDKVEPTEKSKEESVDNIKQSNEARKSSSSKRTQEKITNYTVSLTSDSQSNSTVKDDISLNSTSKTNTSSRSTRRSNKDIESSQTENLSIQIEKETKRKRGRPRKVDTQKQDKKDETAKHDKKDATITENRNESKDRKGRKKEEKEETLEPEIRRSKRAKLTPENNSQLRNHEQSTVYNISSESSVDSPKRKRADLIDEGPYAKRTRSSAKDRSAIVSSDSSSVTGASSTVPSSARTARSTPVGAHRVLFTAFPSELVKEKLVNLGAEIVSDVTACTVVLTLQLRRTFKLLCAVGLGRPIVGAAWVQACVDHNCLVDPWQHLLEDSASEARFKFSLARTLRGPRGYLRGRIVAATPNVLPNASEMKPIVECSGGSWLSWESITSCTPLSSVLVVSCVADLPAHASLRRRGATLLTPEFILSGVLKQQLDIDAYTMK